MESDDVVEGRGDSGPESVLQDAVRHESDCAVLDDRVGVLAAQLHALSAELVDVIAEFEALGGSEGYTSTAQWLSVRAGFTPAEARRLASLAQRRDELPTLLEHARGGQLSVGVVSMAARATTVDNEARVAELALSCTPAQAARVLAKYRTITAPTDPGTDPEPDTPLRAPESWWRTWFDDAGRGRIDAALAPDVAALVHQAWDAARAAGEADQPVTPAADPADAQLDSFARLSADEIASRWATTMLDHAHDHGPHAPGGEHFGVQVSIDVATLARVLHLDVDPSLPIGLGTHAFDPRSGAHLADHDVARFLCTAGIQVIVHHNGVPLWCSNELRNANRHQRRALRARSGGGCEYPGCTQTRYLELHHVTYHCLGGRTDPANLVVLCGHHHRAVHRDEFTITTRGDQIFTFRDPWGRHLGTSTTAEHPGGPPPDIHHLPFLDQPPDPPPWITPDTPRSTTHGEPLTTYALDVYLEHLLAA